MKVLFLDIDGVLNGHEKHPDSPYTTIRPDCVQRLNRVIAATHCQLVISSAWRYMLLRIRRNQPAMTLAGFKYMLNTHGLVFLANGCDIIGYTCSDERVPTRGGQILKWLMEHPSQLDSWAVVDDDPMEMELGKSHKRRLVRTDGAKGLQDKDVAKLIRLLGKS
jgi:HAD domain in Swiss Army Knife RNA repair proteins